MNSQVYDLKSSGVRQDKGVKNFIEPHKLAELKIKPANYETAEFFLEAESRLAAGYVCKIVA